MKITEIINQLKASKVIPKMEGGQLELVGEIERLSVEFIETIRENKTELIRFLRASAKQMYYEPVPLTDNQACYPLSSAQKSIWILSQFEEGSKAYTIIKSFYLKGRVDRTILDKVFKAVISKHESLRTVFKEIGGVPCQFIQDEIYFELEELDISKRTGKNQELAKEIEFFSNSPFQLDQGSLLKAKLVKISASEYALIMGIHHIISDGWSVGVLLNEIMRNYELIHSGGAANNEMLRIQYKDYTEWLNRKFNRESAEEFREYWKNRFSEPIEPLHLSSDFARPEVKSFKGAVSRFYFNAGQYKSIQEFCKSSHISLFSFLHAVLNILLYKYSGQRKLVIGAPVSGRNHFELENQIGLYVNTVALKTEINPDQSFFDYLKQVATDFLNDQEWQAYPFERIVDELNFKRDPARNPLFDIMIVLQDTANGGENMSTNRHLGFELDFLDTYLYKNKGFTRRNVSSKFDLTFDFFLNPGNRFCLEIEYCTDLFKEERIGNFFGMFTYLISQVLRSPDTRIRSLQLLNKRERDHILGIVNFPIANIHEHSIWELLKTSFVKNFRKTAVVFGNKEFSYEYIDKQSDQLSYYLRSNLATSSENPLVGLLMARSEWTLISILAVLKAGAAYVPMDTNYPAARIDFITRDAEPEVIITDKIGAELLPEQYAGRIINLDQEIDAIHSHKKKIAKKKDLREKNAYLIYTSGSTGNPKGVQICHRNVVAFLKWALVEFKNTPFEVLYATTSYCFDLSVFEFLFPLLAGKTVRMLDSATEITQFLPDEDQIMLNTVPSVVRNLLEEKIDLSPVSALNMAGESIPKYFKQVLPYSNTEIRNLYGPSEDTTYSTCYLFKDEEYEDIPIGKPISNTQLYILDEFLNLLPIGVDGEIYLSGQGVAKGYHKLPELTRENFLPNPFLEGQRMYRTGDTGRLLSDGQVIFTGRVDDQVKVRGYRIELSEIQYRLEQLEGVEQAVVVVKEIKGDKHIIAYWKGTNESNAEELKGVLISQLPAYSLPSFFIQLKKIPLNANGKVDKKLLPLPDESILTTSNVSPENETEIRLLALWKQVLPAESFGVTNNFFELGGHSLNATRLKVLIHKELKKEISLLQLFQNPTVRKQAELLGTQEGKQVVNIEKIALSTSYPLSSTQQRLWILSQFKESSKAYNMPGAYTLEGKLEVDALRYTFNRLIERHEILRTVFKTDEEGTVQQFILPPDVIPFVLKVVDMRREDDRELLVKTQVEKDIDECFDLSEGPLMRGSIYQLEDQHWVFTYVMHHIISDGWSMGILINEILELYNAYVENRNDSLAPLKIQFKDYTAWAQQQLAGEQLMKDKQYWLQQFEGNIPVLDFPADKRRPAIKTYNGAVYKAQLHAQLTNKLREFCKQHEGTLFMGLMTMVNAILHRYTSQKDLIIGIPVAGRDQQQLENQIGCYVNTLALRSNVKGEENFVTLFENIKQLTLQAYEHQAYPFDELVNELDLPRDLSRNTLFDVMVMLEDASMSDKRLKELNALTVNQFKCDRVINSKFDLSFDFADADDTILLNIEYNTDIFSAAFMHSFTCNLLRLTELLLEQHAIPIGQLDFLSREERQLLADFNNTTVEYPKDKTIIDLFEEQVLKTPEQTALVVENRSLTYKGLNEQSNQLGNYLRKNYQVKPDDLIGIKLERSEWMVIAMLAVLKSGAAYVPIDPAYPEDRIQYMIKDSQCCLLIDDKELNKFRNRQDDYGRTNRKSVTGLKNLSHVIYTSGSTGQPKGVMIEHKNVLAFIHWCKNEFSASDFETVFAVTSICFDLSVFELLFTLCIGRKIRLLSSALDISRQLSHNEKILLNTVPSVVGSLLSDGVDLSSVKVLNMAGEPIPETYIRSLQKEKMEIRNLYGPTEDTTYSSVYTIKNDDTILIGRPIENTQFYILNDQLTIQPIGVLGEIYIGGDGLARGYLRKLELTNELFIANPFQSGERIYKTGDLGKWLGDGNIELAGRKDDQVKIRGYRIELGEIENVLRKHPVIKEVVVVAKDIGEASKELIAYLVAERPIDVTKLKDYLRDSLPLFMIPSFFIPLECMPLTPNGKVDKKKLPLPDGLTLAASVNYIAPRNETEKKLAAIWQEVLNLDKVGIHDNFFELGGHSLKATRVISRINKEFGTRMEFKSFFNHATLEDQARLLMSGSFNSYDEILPAAGKYRFALSYAQRRLSLLCQFKENNVAYNMIAAFSLDGKLNRAAMERSFRKLIERHEILRTVFKEADGGEQMQYIIAPEDFQFSIEYTDFRKKRDKNSCVRSFIEDETVRPFNLSVPPLIRAYLIQTENDKYVFVYNMHHIISDGWSMNILINELSTHYHACLNKKEMETSALKIQYKDYSNWLEDQIKKGKLDTQRDFWMDHLKGDLNPLELPGGDSTDQQGNFNGKSFSFEIPSAAHHKIKQMVTDLSATEFTFHLAAFQSFLFLYTQKNDIILGIPTSGRAHVDLEEQIGFYVNLLPLRMVFDNDMTFSEAIHKVKEIVSMALSNQMYPLDLLIPELRFKRRIGNSGFINSGFTWQGDNEKKIKFHETLNVEKFPIRTKTVKHDLWLIGNGIDFSIEYRENIFDDSSIHAFVESYLLFMEQILGDSEVAMSKYNSLSEAEIEKQKRKLDITINF